jgi:hypothetical protein
MARIRIAERFEKSDTVRKTFLRGRDVRFDGVASIVARPKKSAVKFRTKTPRIGEHAKQGTDSPICAHDVVHQVGYMD